MAERTRIDTAPGAKLERVPTDVSTKVTAGGAAALVIAIIDGIASGELDPVKFGIVAAVLVLGYYVKDRLGGQIVIEEPDA